MCTVKFFLSGCVQLIGALACATTEEQVSFLLLLSLPSTYLCARMAGKTLCAVHRLFSRSSIRRQTMRADRQTTEGERGAQVRKAARGALETCATLPVLLSAAPSLCIAFQAAMLRVCTCVFFVFGFSPNGSHFFFSRCRRTYCRAVCVIISSLEGPKGATLRCRKSSENKPLSRGTLSLSPHASPAVSLSAKK